MIVRLVGVAIDARAATRHAGPRDRARAARWIAANLLAIRGLRVDLDGRPPACASMLGVDASDLTGALAAIASVPALLDPHTLPWHWRLALRVVGMPLADAPSKDVLARGASVARFRSREDVVLAVGADHRVHVAAGPGELVA